ncbi:hypothetical protein IC582_008354 [Cucumis melo]
MAPPILSLALPSATGRVLCIQSHTFQALFVGGYPTFKGQVLNGRQLWDLIEGLEENELLYYTHLLTGYIGSVSFLNNCVGSYR